MGGFSILALSSQFVRPREVQGMETFGLYFLHGDQGLDPVSCPLQDKPHYLQSLFEADLAALSYCISVKHGHIDYGPVCAYYLA